MRCDIKGCTNTATLYRHGLTVILPGHRDPLDVGRLNLCRKCERQTRVGARASISDDVITAALARR